LQVNGHEAGAQVEGRDQAAAPVHQPKLTQGSWVRPGEVVLERSFADELGVGAGGQVTLNGRSFRAAGVAVTAVAAVANWPDLAVRLIRAFIPNGHRFPPPSGLHRGADQVPGQGHSLRHYHSR